MTTLTRTVVDLAAHEHPGRLERAAHAAVRLGATWPAFTDAFAELGANHRGSRAIEALVVANEGRRPLGSGLEARVLRLLAAAGLPEPKRQVDLGDRRWLGRVDFLYEDQRLIIEVDGGWWHEGPLEVRYDKLRTAASWPRASGCSPSPRTW